MRLTELKGPACPRYLVNFDLRRMPRLETDVLVIGSGAAGLTAALAAAQAGAEVLLLTKAAAEDGCSARAQGGVAAVLEPALREVDDDLDDHVADTLLAGAGHCDPIAVQDILAAAPRAVDRLLHYGCQFNRDELGHPDLTREGGHGHRRILHAGGDATGREVSRVLVAAVRSEPRITMLPACFALDLLGNSAGIHGVVYHQAGEHRAVLAGATILASGGCGQVYRETTNPEVVTGDGMAMAYRAGAVIADAEFMQFHPTTLYIAGAARLLITEAMRGEGAHLKNAAGEAFMTRYHDAGDLAPRDVVTRAIMAEVKASHHPHVWLDATHLESDYLMERFPSIGRTCRGFGIDIRRDWIPVHPSAHYHCGGVVAGTDGATALPGLWACGEVACTGLHGANRLASNSILECLVVGHRAGVAAAGSLHAVGHAGLVAVDDRPTPELDIRDMITSVRTLMWRQVGIERDTAGLAHAGRSLRFWMGHQAAGRHTEPAAWTMQNLLCAACLITGAAESRPKNCGTHFRADVDEGDADVQITLRRPA